MKASLQSIGIFSSIVRKGKTKSGAPGQIAYGNSGRNRFSGKSESRLPVAFAGGAGSDSYRLKPGQLSIVADLGGGKKDELDITGIDRKTALWGKIQIQNDYFLTDLISGMVVVLHDPYGIDNARNKIEFVKAQFRDPETGDVNADRSQRVELGAWLSAAVDFNATLNVPAYTNYEDYNQALAGYRQLNAIGQLQPLLDNNVPAPFKPLVPFVTSVIESLPTTTELGLNNSAAVAAAWETAASNLSLIG